MYEYKIVDEHHLVNLKHVEETLNSYASKGWRLIEILAIEEDDDSVYELSAVMEKQKVQVFE